MAVFSGNGTSSSPSFTFSSDTNTGIYRVGADTIGLATNGSEAVRVTSTGDLQVGNLGGTPHIEMASSGGFSLNSIGQGITFPDGTLQTTAAGSGAVTSVFGRSGTIVATNGDYVLAEIGDVNLTNLQNGQVLGYSNGQWANVTGGGGTPGTQGPKGQKGVKGEIGVGEKGDKGVAGTSSGGTKGEPGTKGGSGDKGQKGIQGLGQKGQKGAEGPDGVQGPKGAEGDTGNTGNPGAKGIKGNKGGKGEEGPKGAKGFKGNDGQSASGTKGEPGFNGSKGQKGGKGDKGPAGTNGTNGAKGQKGTNSSTSLGHSEQASTVTLTSDTGGDTVLSSATNSVAGILTSQSFQTINNSVQKTGDVMSGNLNMESQDVVFDGGGQGTLTLNAQIGVEHSSVLGLYSRQGASQSSFIGDGNGWTCNQQSSALCAGIRYKLNNSWIGFYFVSASTMAAVYNNTAWGNVTVTSSDIRLKEDITSLPSGALSKIKALNPVQFKWINKEHYTPGQLEANPTGSFKFGFIANEVEEIMPEAMIVRDPDEDEPDPIKDYEDRALISVLCKAVQEMSDKLDDTEARLAALEG